MSKRRNAHREKDLTSRYLSDREDDEPRTSERFSDRNKHAQRDKTARTTAMRAAENAADVLSGDVTALPIGEVVQVFSLYSEVQSAGVRYQCVVRKTLNQTSETSIVVGDRVHFRDTTSLQTAPLPGAPTPVMTPLIPEGVIEQILPRATILTRTESFKGKAQHAIVANAQQMLIVVSLREPDVKWGLVDRMIIAAQSGQLRPIVCLNKVDLLADEAERSARQTAAKKPGSAPQAEEALAHYESLGIRCLRTSVERNIGLDTLREALANQTTVLAGHSGVGKSSLVRAVQPQLDLRIGAISGYTHKGRHTTTSARWYALDFGGAVIDTPGVKLFGLWNVTIDNLPGYFPDVQAGTAPPWRQQSMQRISESLSEE